MMHLQLAVAAPVPRPRYVWAAVLLEVFTGLLAIPVGLMFLTDPTGASVGVKESWMAETFLGSYFVPGLYLLLMNGVGMLALALLTVLDHWVAPWLKGVLGVGLIVWILVQLALMPETMLLQWVFLVVGVALGLVALFWLRRTNQLRLW